MTLQHSFDELVMNVATRLIVSCMSFSFDERHEHFMFFLFKLNGANSSYRRVILPIFAVYLKIDQDWFVVFWLVCAIGTIDDHGRGSVITCVSCPYRCMDEQEWPFDCRLCYQPLWWSSRCKWFAAKHWLAWIYHYHSNNMMIGDYLVATKPQDGFI